MTINITIKIKFFQKSELRSLTKNYEDHHICSSAKSRLKKMFVKSIITGQFWKIMVVSFNISNPDSLGLKNLTYFGVKTLELLREFCYII